MNAPQGISSHQQRGDADAILKIRPIIKSSFKMRTRARTITANCGSRPSDASDTTLLPHSRIELSPVTGRMDLAANLQTMRLQAAAVEID